VSVIKLSALALAIAAMFGDPEQPHQEDIASAGKSVDFCNHNVEVDIDGEFDPDYTPSINDEGDNVVSEVWVRTDTSCIGWNLVVTLTGTGNLPLSSDPIVISSQDTVLDADDFPEPILVSDVTDVHVLIDGDDTGDPPADD
jgi:hypothetical protein